VQFIGLLCNWFPGLVQNLGIALSGIPNCKGASPPFHLRRTDPLVETSHSWYEHTIMNKVANQVILFIRWSLLCWDVM